VTSQLTVSLFCHVFNDGSLSLGLLKDDYSVQTLHNDDYDDDNNNMNHSRYSDCLRTGRPRGRSPSPGRVKIFLFSTSSRPAQWPTQHPSQWVRGALSPGVKWPGREANHSPPASDEFKKMWIYTSTPP
jgi:hypothetical protein